MKKFTLICNKCGYSERADICPRSPTGYWDDGFVIECDCGNLAIDIEDNLEEENNMEHK